MFPCGSVDCYPFPVCMLLDSVSFKLIVMFAYRGVLPVWGANHACLVGAVTSSDCVRFPLVSLWSCETLFANTSTTLPIFSPCVFVLSYCSFVFFACLADVIMDASCSLVQLPHFPWMFCQRALPDSSVILWCWLIFFLYERVYKYVMQPTINLLLFFLVIVFLVILHSVSKIILLLFFHIMFPPIMNFKKTKL